MDTFGPFPIKDGRKEKNFFVILFTCMSIRSVHLEKIAKLDADSFINALRRFLARRGAVRSIRSDNGRNFVGATNEFRQCYKDMDHAKIGTYLLSQSCDLIHWKKNPPSGSHFGGVWERQIRTVRAILSSLLHEHSRCLDDESLRTLLAEAECVVNSRPITLENLNDPTCLPLTPNHLLTMKTKLVLPPPGIFQREDIYCRKRWRRVQHLANIFWSRWRKEFLCNLQSRQKWPHGKRNFKKDDIVLLKEDAPRNQWPIARVVKAFPSEDGLVRSVNLRVSSAKSILHRPIQKLVLLLEAPEK